MRKLLFELAAAAVLMFAPVCAAQAADAADLVLKDGWFRTLPGNLPAGGYFTLHNGGTAVATLTGAESPACGMLMLHKTVNESGRESMLGLARVTVPARGRLSFAPGGYHLMCTAPSSAVKLGNAIPVTLSFADGSTLRANFLVRGPTGD